MLRPFTTEGTRLIQLKDVQKEREYYVRLIRRIVVEDTECQGVFEQVLPVLSVMADLLEMGCLTKIHPAIMDMDRRLAGVVRSNELRERHRRISTNLRAIEGAVREMNDPELKELVKGLLTVRLALVTPLGRTTLLLDRKTRAPMPVFVYERVTIAAQAILAERAEAASRTRARA